MSNIFTELDNIDLNVKTLSTLSKEQCRNLHILLDFLLKLHQDNRLAKNYVLSDSIREVLKKTGYKIIEGTAKYGTYDNIPVDLRGLPWDDTLENYNVTVTHTKFSYGDRVRKVSGSGWEGYISGTYSTEYTPEGYAVTSLVHKNSTQIYPASALELDPSV